GDRGLAKQQSLKQGWKTLYKNVTSKLRVKIRRWRVIGHTAKNSAELLWIVGDRRQFNDQGRVPTNRTQRQYFASGRKKWAGKMRIRCKF
ncbi:hypothetical protein AAUPMC_03479, partial [Pasteurella multocida subsp. multocida str. Anand1_cattle]